MKSYIIILQSKTQTYYQIMKEIRKNAELGLQLFSNYAQYADLALRIGKDEAIRLLYEAINQLNMEIDRLLGDEETAAGRYFDWQGDDMGRVFTQKEKLDQVDQIKAQIKQIKTAITKLNS